MTTATHYENANFLRELAESLPRIRPQGNQAQAELLQRLADDELAQALLGAGQQALDTAWRMPLDEEYGESLKSNFADLGNVGGREGGAITAAVFLSKFTQAYRWAHLDIAGSAWKSGAAKGGTGRPVGLLTQFILNQASAGAAAIQPLPAKPAKKAATKKVATKAVTQPAVKKVAAKSARRPAAGRA